MKSQVHFKEKFDEFVWERIDFALKTEPESLEQIRETKQSKLSQTIKDLLGEKNQKLLFDLEYEIGLEDNYDIERSYRQGFMDGELFKKEMGV